MLYTSLIPLNEYATKLLLLNNNSNIFHLAGLGARAVPFTRSNENYQKAYDKWVKGTTIKKKKDKDKQYHFCQNR